MSNHHLSEREWWSSTLMVILDQNQYLWFLQFQTFTLEKFNDQTMLGPVAFDWEWERKAHCSKTRNWFSTFWSCIDWFLLGPTHNRILNLWWRNLFKASMFNLNLKSLGLMGWAAHTSHLSAVYVIILICWRCADQQAGFALWLVWMPKDGIWKCFEIIWCGCHLWQSLQVLPEVVQHDAPCNLAQQNHWRFQKVKQRTQNGMLSSKSCTHARSERMQLHGFYCGVKVLGAGCFSESCWISKQIQPGSRVFGDFEAKFTFPWKAFLLLDFVGVRCCNDG